MHIYLLSKLGRKRRVSSNNVDNLRCILNLGTESNSSIWVHTVRNVRKTTMFLWAVRKSQEMSGYFIGA